MRGNRTPPRGEFGREVTKILIAVEANNRVLWQVLVEGGATCSEKYVNMIIKGVRHPTPEMIDKIGQALGLTPERRQRLHKAAAIDWGYQVGPL